MRYVHVLLLMIPGCGPVGREFGRPAPGTLRLGETRYDDLVALFGSPLGQSTTMVKEGVQADVLTWVYAPHAGAPQTKLLTAWLCGDRLVGVLFYSTFPDEQPEFFDESKLAHVSAGITTRRDLLALFGAPSGEYMHPMVPLVPPGERLILYLRVEPKGADSERGMQETRAATFLLGTDDVVREKAFTAPQLKRGP